MDGMVAVVTGGGTGIGAGVVAYAVIRTGQGRGREVHPLLWFVALAFVAYFGLGVVRAALGLN